MLGQYCKLFKLKLKNPKVIKDEISKVSTKRNLSSNSLVKYKKEELKVNFHYKKPYLETGLMAKLFSSEIALNVQEIPKPYFKENFISEKSKNEVNTEEEEVSEIAKTPHELLNERQEIIEREQISEAVQKYTTTYNNLTRIGKGTSMKHVQRILLGWYDPLVDDLTNEIAEIRSGSFSKDRNQYGPYLLLLPVDKLAVITMDTTLNCIIRTGNIGEKLTKITMEIGDIIEAEVNIQKMKTSDISDYYKERALRSDNFKNSKVRIKSFNSNLRRILKEDGDGWTSDMKVKIGSALVNLLIKVSANERANGSKGIIYTKNYYNCGEKHAKKCGYVKLAEDLYVELSKRKEEFMIPRYLPMLIPPKPWDNTKFDIGCYNIIKAPLMKAISQSQIQAVKNAIIPELLESLDYLGTVGWRVNPFLRDIVDKVVERKIHIGDIANPFDLPLPDPQSCYRTLKTIKEEKIKRELAMAKKKYKKENKLSKQIKTTEDATIPANADATIPVISDATIPVITDATIPANADATIPANADATIPAITDDASTNEVDIDENQLVYDEKYYNSVRNKVMRKNAEFHSLRCDMKIKLMIVRKFANDVIYFPHNLDFRGRAYPIPPNFSHLGADLCRSLLLFSETKQLGTNGLNWLKIHLSNLFGNNKITMQDRISWVDNHMNEIRDSAKNPLDGNRWWSTAENPFQALATCHEIISAIDSGDPCTYKTGLPVHQDGSCNGLQHYAGLGRDYLGGASVNLTNSDAPQDVYSKVLEKVLSKIEEHIHIPITSESVTERQKGIDARLIKDVVNRKVIKQTVMTSVYGVTRIGARKQIEARLIEKLHDDPNVILTAERETEIYLAAQYLAGVTLESLGEMFQSAKEIMDWLGNCAKIVSNQKRPVSWVTPLGLPVEQPYRKAQMHTIQTVLQSITLTLHADYLPVSLCKQKSAFPPNFVHSMDATHMLMTCKKMKNENLSFAAVHDSYWTHPCDVDFMNKSLREAFVDLYERPILEDLRDSLKLRFPEVTFPPIPNRGELDIQEVKDSQYFFH